MNLNVLKEFVLMGDESAKDAFISTLKTRCIQATDVTTVVNGVEEKLFFNSENDTYFDRWMTIYRTCEHCGAIKPMSDITSCLIHPECRRHYPDERLRRKSEYVCTDCVNAENFVVPLEFTSDPNTGESYYGYVDQDNVVKVVVFGDDDTPSVRYACRSDIPVCYRFTYKYDPNATTSCKFRPFAFADPDKVVSVSFSGTSWLMLTSYVESMPDIFARCSHCNRWYDRASLIDGKCRECRDVQIYGYHGWRGRTVFMSTDDEQVNEHTLYFGLEIEVSGPERYKSLIAPVADIFHLEHDSSIGSGFEMISQPMTLAYIKANYDRIKSVLDALANAGMKSHDAAHCGLHIHTSRKAYKDINAVKRAGGIVNALREEMYKFARRDNSCSYCTYTDIGDAPTDEELDRLLSLDRYNAVNFTNMSSDRKQTIEYRIFRGTLNATTLLASVELVNNIVKLANSSKIAVSFGDLLEGGDYIPKYVESRNNARIVFDGNKTVYFGNINNSFAKVKELVRKNDGFLEALNNFLAQAEASSEGAVVSSTVLSD